MDKKEIPDTILKAITTYLGSSETLQKDYKEKLEELKNTFLSSEATVYCEDCGLVFYTGLAEPVANEELFVDWKMLSFRHVWDTKHKVKIYLPFFLAVHKMTKAKSEFWASLNRSIRRNYLGFDKAEQVCYYREVEKLRSSLQGTVFAERSNDENWDAGSTCYCSVCKKEYRNPKDACYCCFGEKPWMPYNIVDTIKVRKFK